MQAWEERYYDREEAREEGREEGRKESKKVFKLYMQGKTVEEIAEICETSIEKIKSILE